MLDKLKGYGIAALAGVIGILVLMLKIKGSQLHKARVDLLRKSIELDTAKDDNAIKEAKRIYKEAKKDYEKSKKE